MTTQEHGASPTGTPGHVVATRSWEDYSVERDVTDSIWLHEIESTQAHHRKAQKETSDLDPVTEYIFISQIADLEQFHWFVQAQI